MRMSLGRAPLHARTPAIAVAVGLGSRPGSRSRASMATLAAAHRLAGVAVHHQVDHAALAGLGDHDDIGDHQNGVGAQFAIYRFHQVNAVILHPDVHGRAVPSGPAAHRLAEREHQLLRVQHRRFGIVRPFAVARPVSL